MLPTQLCDICSALQVEETLQELAEAFVPPLSTDSDSPEESRSRPWHTDLSLLNNYSSPCVLCKLVLQGLREARRQLVENTRHSGDWPEPPKDLDDDILTISWYSVIGLKVVAWPLSEFEGANTVSLRTSNEEKLRLHAMIQVTCHGGDQVSSSWDGYGNIEAELRLSYKAGQATKGRAEIDRTIESDPFSENVFDQLRFWLSTCTKEHQSCQRDRIGSAPLPTRFLDVGIAEPSLVYLCEQDESAHLSAPYTALSHCWGLSQPFTTTMETLESRKQGIRIDELPQTFQDAIAVTRGLGIQYIWIDSLCIIQNDNLDWQRESAKMTTVYRRAHIVIGASNATADSEGFLCTRATPTISLGLIHVKLLPPYPKRLVTTLDPVSAEPLSTRAWCLQERYLPRRMLLVGKDQMYWECSEMIASEDGDCVPRDGDHFEQIKKTAAIDLSITGISGRSPGETTDINYFDWYETVKEYAQRHITKGSDRLPALGGLARALYGATSDKYFAGIWQKGLIEGLLWCRADGMQALSSPAVYRAPSWSWASVDGAINFPVYNFYDRCNWKFMMASFEPLATYVDSSLDLAGENPFGGIKDGWIKLQGPVLPIMTVRNWTEISYSPPEYVMNPFRSSACNKVIETTITHNGKTETIFLDAGFDTSDRTVSQGTLFAVLIARLPDPASPVYMDIRFGLILEAVAQDKYKRVGMIDGVVKTQKATLLSRLSRKVHLENYLWEQPETKEEEENPNLLGPDPFEGLEQTVVTIV